MISKQWWTVWESKIKSESWSLETTSWSSMLTDWSMKFKLTRILNWNKVGSKVLRSSLHIMFGTHKTLVKKKLNMANAKLHLFGSVYKVVLMRCKNVDEDWSSTYTRKKGSWMSLRKVFNNQFRRNSLLSRNSVLFN